MAVLGVSCLLSEVWMDISGTTVLHPVNHQPLELEIH